MTCIVCYLIVIQVYFYEPLKIVGCFQWYLSDSMNFKIKLSIVPFEPENIQSNIK